MLPDKSLSLSFWLSYTEFITEQDDKPALSYNLSISVFSVTFL